MPTGYTAAIGDDNVSFEEFTLLCARNFGACIMQRDDNPNEKPKLQEPSSYYTKELESLKTYKAPTKQDFETWKEKEIKARKQSIIKSNKLRQKYEAMLEKVTSWQPPTKDHLGLKEFMVSQITDSIGWDCDNDYDEKEIRKLEKITYTQYAKDCKNNYIKDKKYYQEEYEKEIERVNNRNNWIKGLYNSLGMEIN